MKKIIVNVLFLILSFCLVGCVADEQKQFDSSLKVGLFQGISENNPELTICLEFTEMDTMEYVKRDFYKVKDLSTIDTKFFSTYWVNFIISTKNENYVVHPLTFASKLTNWEYGSHYVFLIKGKKVIESEVDYFENIVDSKFYGTDH